MSPKIANKLITKVDWLLNPHPLLQRINTDRQYHWDFPFFLSHDTAPYFSHKYNFWQLDWLLLCLFPVTLLFVLLFFSAFNFQANGNGRLVSLYFSYDVLLFRENQTIYFKTETTHFHNEIARFWKMILQNAINLKISRFFFWTFKWNLFGLAFTKNIFKIATLQNKSIFDHSVSIFWIIEWRGRQFQIWTVYLKKHRLSLYRKTIVMLV